MQMENRKIAQHLIEDGFAKSVIIGDSEDPRTINELRLLGLRGIRGAKKGKGSVLGGIQKLQDYEIIVSPACPHTIEALSNYAWKKDKVTGELLNEPEHDFSHLMDALRYATEELKKPNFYAQYAASKEAQKEAQAQNTAQKTQTSIVVPKGKRINDILRGLR